MLNLLVFTRLYVFGGMVLGNSANNNALKSPYTHTNLLQKKIPISIDKIYNNPLYNRYSLCNAILSRIDKIY